MKRSSIAFFLAAIVTALLIHMFVFDSFFVPSTSMVPTLKVGDHMIASKLFGVFGVSRGDIMIFDNPPGDKTANPSITYLVKRVIGLPGETISASGGKVYINGEALSEPYLASPNSTFHLAKIKIPKGDYFMMGDNRRDSYDSRFFGVVPGSLFVGQAVIIYYPFPHFSVL